MIRTLFVSAILMVFASTSAYAGDKVAKCEIYSQNHLEFKGGCKFLSETGGSFSLQSLKKDKPLYDDVIVLSVYVERGGLADVRGLTPAGINSRWGEAHRSSRDRACWVGEDFEICAR